MTDRLTLVSADCHAGASMDTYREYLEREYLDEYDRWRAKYANPFRDLQGDGRTRNWDGERRLAEQEADGVVAEVVFPNTVPPFFPTGALIARPPSTESYALRLAGLRAHNRWLADWCATAPGRRAGVAQIFLNDVDDAIDDVRWAKEHGLPSVLLPTLPPDVKHIAPLHSPAYDELWAVCQDLDVVVTNHGGGGLPDYGPYPAAGFLWIAEASFFSRRALTQLLVSGVFERFPRLRLVLTEQGCSWVPGLLSMLDGYHAQMRTGRIGELKYAPEDVLPLAPSEYFGRNVWVGCSFPSPKEAAARHEIGVDRFLWGSDYPHNESTYPYTREGLRHAFAGTPRDELQQVLAGNAAAVYGFDLDALAPVAARVGPTYDELSVPLDAIPADSASPAFHRP